VALTNKLTNLAANTEADAVAALLNSGKIRIYDGAQPATADTALSGQNLLAELTFGNPAFGAAVAGVATANAITGDSSADYTGTAAWFRAFKSDGTTAVFDGSVGTSGCNININSTSITAGGSVNCTAFTFTANKT
jgi:hypothetical protein